MTFTPKLCTDECKWEPLNSYSWGMIRNEVVSSLNMLNTVKTNFPFSFRDWRRDICSVCFALLLKPPTTERALSLCPHPWLTATVFLTFFSPFLLLPPFLLGLTSLGEQDPLVSPDSIGTFFSLLNGTTSFFYQQFIEIASVVLWELKLPPHQASF